jgi:hypothetical protein
MASIPGRIRHLVVHLWRSDAPLTATGLAMIPLLGAFAAGLWLDPRTITGAPAWLKPAKFAASIAIYSLTLAWIFGNLRPWARTRKIVGRTTAAVMAIEIAIIATQAWRGTTSHFNVGTVADGLLYTIMGGSIVLQTLATVAVGIALWREPFGDRALGVALRAGMAITIVGALSGGLMTRPTPAQLAAARATGRMPIAGAHTVGAHDGGRGMPGTGWSVDYGDLRVAHFLGLHALQVLPLIALITRRPRWTDAARVRLAATSSVSYAALFGLLLWQALRGQSILQPDPLMATALATWAAATVAGGRESFVRRRPAGTGVVSQPTSQSRWSAVNH